MERDKFCNTLERFWTRFANNWDVLLHGSPAVDIFGGLKLAAGGELGIGVGEEEWGSGEREVLEDFARRTDGLVDIVVSRFGEPSSLQNPKSTEGLKAPNDTSEPEPWMGSGKHANSSDGVVFSGTGALSRRSLRDLSHWIEDIYTLGEYAYGVKDNPTADRRKRRRRNLKPSPSGRSSPERKGAEAAAKTAVRSSSPLPPGIPPPIVTAVESSLDKASAAVEESSKRAEPNKSEPLMASLADTETWMKYLTLGYGTAWGGKRSQSGEQNQSPETEPPRDPSPEVAMRYIEPEPDIDRVEEKLKRQVQSENAGYFIVGLKGDMEDEDIDDENEEGLWNNRIFLRTVHVDLVNKVPETPATGDEVPFFEKELSSKSSTTGKLSRLRPVVYIVGR